MARSGSKIVHPRLMQSLGYHHASDVTIQEPYKDRDEFGEETILYRPIPHMQALKGYKEPVTRMEGEQRFETYTIVEGLFNVQIQGYYPSISRIMQAIVDGRAYNITNVWHDDSKTLTYIAIESINKQSEQPYSDE